MTLLRRTWMATAMFVLASIVAWQRFIDWEAAWRHVLPTLFLTPLVWWVLVGWQPKPRLWRGIVGGALTGFVTQAAENIPLIWGLVSRRGTYKGDEGFGAMAALAVLLLICFWAIILGALVGLVAAAIQRRMDGRVPSS